MQHRHRGSTFPRSSSFLLASFLLAFACESAVGPPDRPGAGTPPAVVDTTPAAGALGVDSTAAIAVTFNRPMNASTVRPGVTFRVAAGTVSIPGSVMSNEEQTHFVFMPASTLPGSRQIDVVVSDVADAEGNWLAAPYGFSFQTAGVNPLPPRVPANPYPSAGAQGVSNDTTFTWTGGADDDGLVVYDFWLGAGAQSMTERATGLTATQFAPGPLAYATGISWKIVARSAGGTTPGPVWTFTTEAAPPTNDPPPAPCAPYPEVGAPAVPDTTRFEWGCIDDPDGDAVSFEVYLGTTDPPPHFATVGSPLFVPPDPLLTETRYYWRVVADDGRGGRASGPLWRFDTAAAPVNAPPGAPADPVPAHQATAVPMSAALGWSGGADPDGDPVVFVVFLERDDATAPDSVAVVGVRSYTPPLGLAPGAFYYWRIEARDGRGGGTSSSIWSFTTNAPPTEPCTPDPADDATGVGIIVRLNWDCGLDPEGQGVTYDVYFGTTPDPAGPIATVPARTYLVGGVLPGQTYYWRIVARDNLGATTSSPVWSFSTLPLNQPPFAPCSPHPQEQAADVPDTTRFEWACAGDPDGDAVSFEVYLGATETPPLVATLQESVYSPPTPLSPDTRYYWRVVHDDGRGGRTSGPLWTFATAAPPPINLPPFPPQDPLPAHDATGVGTDATISWGGGNDQDGDQVTYVVFLELGDAADPDSVAAVGEKAYTPAIPFAPGGDYYWRVEARDARGAVTPGPLWHFTIHLPPDAPCDPTPDDGAGGIGLVVRLRWRCGQDPEGEDVDYDVYLGTTSEPGGPIATVGNRNYLLSGVLPGQTYYWRIVARDDRGAETSGPVWSFSTLLGAPAGGGLAGPGVR